MQLHSSGHNCSSRAHCSSSHGVRAAAARCSSRAPVRRSRLTCPASSQDGEANLEAHRDTVKHLTRLFYATPKAGSSREGEQQRRPRVLKGSHIPQLPLWRVEWAVLPGMQEILHVLAPHYVHMFEAVFSEGRPWLFGHLYLPGGSKSLGSPSHALASGSKAPLVGVLMSVTRAVRLRDGKFLLLATALGRFKVTQCVRELPYSAADVELLEDCEPLEALSQDATAAVLQAACEDCSVSGLMAASTAAAREAAAASHWAWLRGYELKVAAGQDWPGPGPREGENDMETYALVQELAEQGVADVLPLPDGVVIGRCNLQQVSADAAAAAQQALQEAAKRLTNSSSSSSSTTTTTTTSSSSSSSPLSSTEGLAAIASLNTVAERGVALQGAEVAELTGTSSCSSSEEVLMLEAAVWQQLDILAALSARVKGRRHSLPFGLLQLRPPRPQLSVAAATILANQAAAARLSQDGSRAGGPELGSSSSSSSSVSSYSTSLQPPAAEVVSDTDDDDCVDSSTTSSSASSDVAAAEPPVASSSDASPSTPLATSDAAAGSSSLSSRSTAAASGAAADPSRYAFAASEGMDVHADPLWPPLRRAAKLSWAAALVTGELDLDKGAAASDMRQALLEAPSIASRLRYVLAVLQKHSKVLAALVAVKDVQQEK